MPKQLNSSYNEVAIPFQKMNFVPDVPSSQLGANEYNDGFNVETDVRGIRSVAGDIDILTTIQGTPTYVSGGFRQGNEFWFIVATTEGKWWATNGTTQDWYDITPGEGVGTYAQNTNITEAWNGTIPFFNDAQNPPMFFPDEPYPAKMVMYKGLIQPSSIDSLTVGVSTVTLAFGSSYSTPPYVAGDKIIITGVDTYFNGIFTVVSCSTTSVTYTAVPGAAAPSPVPDTGLVSSAYTWNYNPFWQSYYANFMRLYSTPNVGSILVAGNLTTNSALNVIQITASVTNDSTTVTTTDAATSMIGKCIIGDSIPLNAIIIDADPGVSLTISKPATDTKILMLYNLYDVNIYPVTIQWSQAFGLNQAPQTWQPTITNVANQLEVPLRGPALDAFPCNGQFFLCSYWDTVVFSPLNYSTTSAPILGVRLYNQGRGLLSSNCWANTDKLVYGVDARDIWVFDGTDFQGLGNQQVKNWFFDQLDPMYYDTVFMEVNSQKNQVEIYYYTSNAPVDETDSVGVPNRMLSYRYDLQVWNAPRKISSATMSCESPIWNFETEVFNGTGPSAGLGLLAETVTGVGTNGRFKVTISDTLLVERTSAISSDFEVGDTLKILGTQIGGTTPLNDINITVTNAPGGDIAQNGFTYTCSDIPVVHMANLGSRTIVYARGKTNEMLVQKDYGYEINNEAIYSYFKRSNIKLLKDYSGKLMVHRLLPETVNLGGVPFTGDYNKQVTESTGNISIRIDGSESVGQLPVQTTDLTMQLNTSNPWLQPNQNSHRVNTITIENTSNTDIWMTTATTWQYTQVEDDR